MSIEAVTPDVMTEDEARRLTERIRYTALGVRDGVEKLQRLVAEAQEGQAHVALGYKSWTAYLADVMGDEPLVLARDQRRDVVAWLSGEGMSSRAIAPIVGASRRTIDADVAASQVGKVAHLEGPDLSEPEFAARVANASEKQFEAALAAAREDDDLSRANVARHIPDDVEPADDDLGRQYADVIAEAPPVVITGMDGKRYTRPEPKPRRSALIDAIRPQAERIWNTAIELRSTVGDDRFAANRASISGVVLPRVRSAALDLTAFLAELDLSSATETEEARDRLAADLNHISETFARLARSLTEEPK